MMTRHCESCRCEPEHECVQVSRAAESDGSCNACGVDAATLRPPKRHTATIRLSTPHSNGDQIVRLCAVHAFELIEKLEQVLGRAR